MTPVSRQQTPLKLMACRAVLALSLMVGAVSARADGGLVVLNNPGGGQITYGPLEKQSSLSEAMGFMLRQIHGHFGDKPRIGKLFRAKNSDSVAAFFSLTPKVNGKKPITGMLIVTMPRGIEPAAAVIYDESDHFSKSMNAMLTTLNEAWKPSSTVGKGAERSTQGVGEEGSTRKAVVMPLHQHVFPDNSGSISLPEGWQITAAAGGMVHANGPKGEQIHLGVILTGIFDPNNPNARMSIQMKMRSGMPFLAYPFGGDLVAAYKAIAEQNHRIAHLPVPTITVKNSNRIPHSPYEANAAMMAAEIDNHDGKGPLLASIRIGEMRPGAIGAWSLCITGVMAPKALAEEEWPTIKAIFASWRQNGQVIQKQTDDVIHDIHKIGEEATARINRVHAAEDEHNRQVYKQWDNQEKYSKSFQNYQFGNAIIQDNDARTHETLDYNSADWLVKSDPQRYQYVDTPNFLKGIDY